MSFLQKISLTQFRNFGSGSFRFTAPVTGITGLNGSGKTNLLDAIYYLCYTKSYFQSRDSNNVQYGTEGFRIDGRFDSGQVVCKWKEGKKTIEHDGVLYEKITEHIGRYTAVMIAPDDIALINEGSELRRKFMDGLLSQSSRDYLEHLLLYQKVLVQRNALLRQAQQLNHELLDIYDAQLAMHGACLIREREQLSEQLPARVQSYYTALSGGAEQVDLQYRRSAAPGQLLALLQHSRRRDIEYRRTLTGPHTEDWLFTISGNPLKAHASQGQKKSFLISLKLAHIHWLLQQGKHPLLLLDDIFEKLDRERLKRLFGLLQQFSLSQIFISHTNGDELLNTTSEYYKDAVEILGLTA